MIKLSNWIRVLSFFSLILFFTCKKVEIDNTPEKISSIRAMGGMKLSSAGLPNLPCGTPQNAPNLDFERMADSRGITLTSSNRCINVVFHIVRNSDGSGGFDAAQINNIIQNLNNAYNQHDIYFYNGGVDFINNTEYYDLQYGPNNDEFSNLIKINNSPHAINFYLVNNIFGARQVAGIAQNVPSRNLAVDLDYALLPTSAHEVGHCLNLFHTHRGLGCEGDGCPEKIDGSNCSTCGDYVCDTPADPCLSDNVNWNCQYTGGGGYVPLVNNLMSYAGACRTSFTNGQGSRMRAALDMSNVLQPVLLTNCVVPTISGLNTLCNQTLYTINNLPPNANVIWSADPIGRVILSNQTSSSVTLQQIPGLYGSITLRAMVFLEGNSISVYKNIALPTADVPSIALTPSSIQCLTMNSSRSFAAGYANTGAFQYIDNHPNVSEVDWLILDYSTNPASQITNYSTYNTNVLRSSIRANSLHSHPSDYVIEILGRAKHKCGPWGDWGPGHAYFVRRNCTSSFQIFDISYDKQSNDYTLEFSADYKKLRAILSEDIYRKARMTDVYELWIYNSNGTNVYSDKTAKRWTTTLPSLSFGNYKIVLLQDGNVYEQSLKINYQSP